MHNELRLFLYMVWHIRKSKIGKNLGSSAVDGKMFLESNTSSIVNVT